MEVEDRSQLLLETSLRHGSFEATAPPHDWWDWYAAYMVAREGGEDADTAAASADRYVADVKGVVGSSAGELVMSNAELDRGRVLV